MDIKKFLKDNKGCPLTVPAIKQLLVKFIELMSEQPELTEEEMAWVSQMKELISIQEIDENHYIYFEYPFIMAITDILNNIDGELIPYFPDLVNQAGKAVVVNEDETGFEYQKVPRVWISNADFDVISSELLEKLQVGDLIYSSSYEGAAQVDFISTNLIYIKYYDVVNNILFTYTKEDDEWSCEIDEVLIDRTYYRHHLDITTEYSGSYKHLIMDVISKSNTVITSSNMPAFVKGIMFVSTGNIISSTGVTTGICSAKIDIVNGYPQVRGTNSSGDEFYAGIQALTDTVTEVL